MTISVSPARMVAARLLHMLERDEALHGNETLAKLATEAGLRGDDARLARAIAFGVLRNALMLDHLYGQWLVRPANTLDTRLRVCLRMAAFQKFLLDRVPDYAIVNETVEVGRRVFKMPQKQAGFLNAVLRKMVAEPGHRELPTGNKASELSVRYSYPKPFVDILVKKYGTHKAVALMEACNGEPALVLRANTLITSRDELAEALAQLNIVSSPGQISPHALVVDGSSDTAVQSLFDLDLFRDGHFYVQDEASQLVAFLVAPVAGERILDLCGAPGGKTTHMAELAGGGAHITVTDLSEQRLLLVEENIARLKTPGITISPLNIATDAKAKYDAVLVDAPCSGMGTVRRNPEIRYRITPESQAHQQVRQRDALRLGAGCVKPGGRLIYSTCSVSDVENRDVIAKFLRENNDFEIWAEGCAGGAVLSDGLVGEDGFVRTWPVLPELDGFEAVVLRRK